ncbi:uncharacterized protein VTP21DRAFT_5329 [Calcarisporiella thermophila]|uniref:uncharacterized protein n=1 Tax=Calcarisporiella thermophila TaxID=911321 RepID=UPI003742706B
MKLSLSAIALGVLASTYMLAEARPNRLTSFGGVGQGTLNLNPGSNPPRRNNGPSGRNIGGGATADEFDRDRSFPNVNRPSTNFKQQGINLRPDQLGDSF